MYWMLKINWVQDNLVLAKKCAQNVGYVYCSVKNIYTGKMMGYCSNIVGCHQKLALSMENYWNLTLCTNLDDIKDNFGFWFVFTSKTIWIWMLNWFHARRRN